MKYFFPFNKISNQKNFLLFFFLIYFFSKLGNANFVVTLHSNKKKIFADEKTLYPSISKSKRG